MGDIEMNVFGAHGTKARMELTLVRIIIVSTVPENNIICFHTGFLERILGPVLWFKEGIVRISVEWATSTDSTLQAVFAVFRLCVWCLLLLQLLQHYLFLFVWACCRQKEKHINLFFCLSP